MEENITPAPPVRDKEFNTNALPPKPKLNLKPIFLIFAILGIFLLVFCIGAWFYIQSQPHEVACTLEAKICSDGTAVGRTGPKCEFAPCPGETKQIPARKYTDRGHRFAFDYPDEYSLREHFGGSENDIYYYYLNGDSGQLRIEAGDIKHSTWYENAEFTEKENINGLDWTVIPARKFCDAGNCSDLPPGYFLNRGNYYIAALDMDSKDTSSKNLKLILGSFVFIDSSEYITQAEKENIIKAVSERDNIPIDKLNLSFNPKSRFGDYYASGNVMVKDEMGGGLWFAKKINEEWKIVWTGNGLPTCSEIERFNLVDGFLTCY